MKSLLQLLKFNSKSGPLDLFPDWNVIAKFANLNFDGLKEKDFEIFSQSVVLLLSLSNKANFLDRVKGIELFRTFYEGVTKNLYMKRDQEMKNIILEVNNNNKDSKKQPAPRLQSKSRKIKFPIQKQIF